MEFINAISLNKYCRLFSFFGIVTDEPYFHFVLADCSISLMACGQVYGLLILLVLLSSNHFDCKFFVIIFKVSFLENSDYNIYPLLGNWTIIIANTFATKSSCIDDEPRI